MKRKLLWWLLYLAVFSIITSVLVYIQFPEVIAQYFVFLLFFIFVSMILAIAQYPKKDE